MRRGREEEEVMCNRRPKECQGLQEIARPEEPRFGRWNGDATKTFLSASLPPVPSASVLIKEVR